MSKYAEDRIKEIKELTEVTIPTAIKNGITVDQYLRQYRMTLNLTLIQAIFGVEFTKPKKEDGDIKIKFRHKLATTSQLATISKILNEFIIRYEKDILYNSGYQCFTEEDNMEIPDRNMELPLPTLEKINSKKINEYIFGTASKYGTSTSLITALDVYDLAATAEQIRKVKNRNTILLIGGITLVVTGGAIAAISIANSKRKEDKEDVEEIEDNISIDEIDGDIGDIMDIEDMPQIDI